MKQGNSRIEQVADGIWRLVLPLPFVLDQVNIWLLEDGDGWTIVDTGFGDQITKQIWEEVSRVFLLDKPLKRIILTHHHIDHCALADWLSRGRGAEVYLTEAEVLVLNSIEVPAGYMLKGERTEFYLQHGMTGGEIRHADLFFEQIPVFFSGIPDLVQHVTDGDKMQIGSNLWEVLEFQGHSPGHLTLYCENLGLWISGDHVLPMISPNISVGPDAPDNDPLGKFLESFLRLRQMPENTRVLPSHGKPFVGLHKRLDELQQHHENRLDEILYHCRKLQTAGELARVIFPAVIAQQSLWMAIGEVVAHLNLLMQRGMILRQSDNTGGICYLAVN